MKQISWDGLLYENGDPLADSCYATSSDIFMRVTDLLVDDYAYIKDTNQTSECADTMIFYGDDVPKGLPAFKNTAFSFRGPFANVINVNQGVTEIPFASQPKKNGMVRVPDPDQFAYSFWISAGNDKIEIFESDGVTETPLVDPTNSAIIRWDEVEDVGQPPLPASLVIRSKGVVSSSVGDVHLKFRAYLVDNDANVLQTYPPTMVKMTVLECKVINPVDSDDDEFIDDPATQANNYTGNEFTYSTDFPTGILTIPVRIRIRPDVPWIRDHFEDQIEIHIDQISDSHSDPTGGYVQFAWNNPSPTYPLGGIAEYDETDGIWKVTATFTGLPPWSSNFGGKMVDIEFLDVGGLPVLDEQVPIEVFWPYFLSSEGERYERETDSNYVKNHPDLQDGSGNPIPDLGYFSATDVDTARHGNSERSPNWFFYWSRTPAGGAHYTCARYNHDLVTDAPDPQHRDPVGCASAGTFWGNGYEGQVTRMLIAPGAGGSGFLITGIDTFAALMCHEWRHVLQIQEHNALAPYSVAEGARFSGYSWTTLRVLATLSNRRYNHFRGGGDGEPGTAGVDDSYRIPWGVGKVDDLTEFVEGPPDPAIANDIGSVLNNLHPSRIDEDLDRDGDGISHLVWSEPDPEPNLFDGYEIERQANRAASEVSQDEFRQYDWGDPGKQHGPDLPEGEHTAQAEVNSYDD